MCLLCIMFFNPHNCYPRCRGDSEAKWVAKGYTVRRYLTDSKDLKSPTTLGLSQPCRNQTLDSLSPQRAPAQSSLQVLQGAEATSPGEEGQSRARNQSTVYCKGNALGPPATQMRSLRPAPSPGELCLLKQIKRRRWSQVQSLQDKRQAEEGDRRWKSQDFVQALCQES